MSKHAEGNRDEQADHTPAEPSLRVLVVENHQDTRQGIGTFLEMLGCRVVAAETAAQALVLADQQRFDVLLCDISLPDGTGWELLPALAARGCRPPRAIAMSGLSTAADQARSREAGFEVHLVKPFHPDELEAVLRRTADLPSHADAPPRPPETPAPPPKLRQRMHDGLCQHLAAAALLQAAVVNRLEKMAAVSSEPVPGLGEITEECQQISRLLDEALQETLSLLRSL